MHLTRHRMGALAREQGGFAMVTVLAVMLVASLVAVAAVTAADNDRLSGSRDTQHKQAYAAAEAGVNDYLARLVANVDYWRKCGNDPGNPSLNQRYTGTGTRNWATVPGTTAKYSVEVLPANGSSQCLSSDPMGTFIDTATGTFRIRATGMVADEKRSIIATFKRRGFLDYVYFTDYETPSPEFYKRDSRGQSTRWRPGATYQTLDITTWATEHCAKYYRHGGQRDDFTNGQRYETSNNTWVTINPVASCGSINFVSGDKQNGPFHTNDEILVCGTPSFGRRPSDDIEVSAPDGTAGGVGSSTGWRNCGNGAPQVNDPTDTTPNAALGTWRKGSPKVEMPPSNTAMKSQALPAYRFVGKVNITLQGKYIKFNAAAKRENGTTVLSGAVVPMPEDGVLWVSDDPSKQCLGYDPLLAEDQPAAQLEGCGNVWVNGDYDYSLSIGAENDIIVTEDLTRDSVDDVMLGLIADDWIRVSHPTSGSMPYSSCTNEAGPGTITIHAALLAVKNSFTVDRYWCGASTGTLNVTGAIAQRYRGPVGTSGNTGYIKNYTYDDRLKFRTPPHFLDPIQASWKIQNQVEQVPAT